MLKGLVDLAFVLLAVENKSKTEPHPLWQIGMKILQKIMKNHHETVATVFQMLIDKIMAESCTSQYSGKIFKYFNILVFVIYNVLFSIKTNSYYYLFADVLAYMCHKLAVLVLDHQDAIITLFDHISSVSGENGIFIVSAVFPLIQISIPLRDNLILILRKTLYRKGTANRQMAVSGILEMLKNLKMHCLNGLVMSSSQYANSSSTGTSSASILTQV